MQEAIAEAGIVPHVLALCGAAAHEVQAEAADVLKVLGRNPGCARLIRSRGGVATLEVHPFSRL